LALLAEPALQAYLMHRLVERPNQDDGPVKTTMHVGRTSRKYLRARVRAIRAFIDGSVGECRHSRLVRGLIPRAASHLRRTELETFVHHGTRGAFRGLHPSKLDEVRL